MRKLYLLPLVFLCFMMPLSKAEAKTVAYISSDNTAEITEKDPMSGRLFIPDVHVQVGLYDVDSFGTLEERQTITDLENAAAMYSYGDVTMIGDHNYQGFDRIQNVTPGKTIAYIQTGFEFSEYVAVECGIGRNETTHIYDENGEKLYLRGEDTIVTTTCLGDDPNSIFYVIWKPFGYRPDAETY